MLLAAGLATAGLAFLLLPVVLAFTGARRRDGGGFDISAQAAVLAGLLGVRLLRRDPAWELVPVHKLGGIDAVIGNDQQT